MLRSVAPTVYRAIRAREDAWLAALCGGLLLLVYGALFLPLLPNRDGGMGHDYAYWLPNLLAGYFWFRENGLWEIPWFTPAFCGGIPYFPNPQIGYFSVPQGLTLVLPPVAAIRLTMLAFAAIGYAGACALLRRTFGIGIWATLLGAGLFMFNGFYAHRMLIGHLSFHGFMLVPLAAWALVPVSPRAEWRGRLGTILGGGLIFAYMFYSGMVHLIPVCAVAVAGIAMIVALRRDWTARTWLEFIGRFAGAAVFALSLSAAKLVAVAAFLQQFPRDQYPLPGLPTPWSAFLVAFRSLFFGPSHELVNAMMVNAPRALGRHELEFGITVVPFPLILAGIILLRRARARSRPGIRDRHRRCLTAAGLLAVLALPLILNWYTPGWNLILKHTPYIGSSSSLLRWIALYIPLLIVMAALAFDHWGSLARYRPWLALGGLAAVVLLNATADRAYYAGQAYLPRTIEAAHASVGAGGPVPRVGQILLPAGGRQAPRLALDRNDSLAIGSSQGLCYEPMFGYGLGAFPFGVLRDGAVDEAQDGVLNIKKPACFVFPDENACRPGDHYTIGEADAAAAFASYRPIDFATPVSQQVANRLSLAALAGTPFLVAAAVWRRRPRWGSTRRRRPAGTGQPG